MITSVSILLFYSAGRLQVVPILRQGDTPYSMIWTCNGMVAGGAVSYTVGVSIRRKIKKQESLPPPVPTFEAVPYPHHIFDIEYEDIVWPIHAQDPWPSQEEPLVINGARCPKCKGSIGETKRTAADLPTNEYLWKCSPCKFAVTKKDSIETILERVLELAQERLKDRKSSK